MKGHEYSIIRPESWGDFKVFLDKFSEHSAFQDRLMPNGF